MSIGQNATAANPVEMRADSASRSTPNGRRRTAPPLVGALIPVTHSPTADQYRHPRGDRGKPDAALSSLIRIPSAAHKDASRARWHNRSWMR